MRAHPWLGHTLAVALSVCGVIAVAVGQAWPWWDYVFFSDDSPVSWLSSALLAGNAAVAMVARLGDASRRRFGALALACLVLAVDEQMHFHEGAQSAFGDHVSVAYGAALVAGGLVWMRVAARDLDSRVRRFLWLALAFGAVAVVVEPVGVGLDRRTVGGRGRDRVAVRNARALQKSGAVGLIRVGHQRPGTADVGVDDAPA